MEREDTYTVTELAAALGRAVDRAFPDEIWVQGEIRDLSRPPSGHVYFSLVDPGEDPNAAAPAMLAVTLFATDKIAINRVLLRSGAGRFDDGIAVRIRGRLGYYATRGTVQLRMLWIDTDYTLGKLAAERARVLEALAEDGLLDRNRSLPYPVVPLRIGLITSAGSAAHADFMEELAGAGHGFQVTVYDTRVQGAEAEASLIAALDAASGSEIIAIVRGGGSRSDLAAFDREGVARAVAVSPVPVIVGIGHEIDESVVDRVAARSYRTPTACAAGLVADVAAFLRRLDGAGTAIAAATRRTLIRADSDLASAGTRIDRAVNGRLRRGGEQVASLSRRIPVAARRVLGVAGDAVASVGSRIATTGDYVATRAEADTRYAQSRLSAADRLLERSNAQVETVAATIGGLDPARVLARGWTMTLGADGRIVRRADALEPGDAIATVFAVGRVTSTVDDVYPGPGEAERPQTESEQEQR